MSMRYMLFFFTVVYTFLGSEHTVLTQQQQSIINQQAIILVCLIKHFYGQLAHMLTACQQPVNIYVCVQAQQMTMQAIAIQQQMLSSFPPVAPAPQSPPVAPAPMSPPSHHHTHPPVESPHKSAAAHRKMSKIHTLKTS